MSRRSAFTLIELLIGMVITSIVLLALSGVTLSVAQGWSASDGTQALQIQSAQIYARLRHYLSSAKYITQVTPGSLNGSAAGGCVCFWAYDGGSYPADGLPQAGEMAMIQHDPTTQTLWLYQPIAYSSMNTSQQGAANTTMTWATISALSWPVTWAGYVTQPPKYVVATAIGHNVKGALFAVSGMSSTTQRPVVEITLVLNRSPQPASTQYETIVLRAPGPQPP
jgi:prepilin-type N-terminal cleavage/methylation domain-containing protein